MQPISIRTNVRAVRAVVAEVKRQMPFAIAKGINDVTLAARNSFKASAKTRFIVRRPWVFEGFRVTLTKKSAPVKQTRIALDDSRDFLAQFEEGGQKRSRSGASLSVPIRKTPTEITPKALRIRALQLRKHVTTGQAHITRKGVATTLPGTGGKVQLKGLQGTFVAKGANGTTYVLQRLVRGRNSLGRKRRKRRGGGIGGNLGGRDPNVRVLYVFKRSVPIDARLHFVRELSAYVRENHAQAMREAVAYALATAKTKRA